MSISSSSMAFLLIPPLQLPTMWLNLIEFMTRKVWVDFSASLIVGLLFTRPCCRMQPKKFSKGSWLSLPLKKKETPGSSRISGTSSKNEFTVYHANRFELHACKVIMTNFVYTCNVQSCPSLTAQHHSIPLLKREPLSLCHTPLPCLQVRKELLSKELHVGEVHDGYYIIEWAVIYLQSEVFFTPKGILKWFAFQSSLVGVQNV